MKKTALVIAGPTASGKSGLALALAERWGGVVINADSMQVYADLPILTARPGPADLARAPHRLYGYLDRNQVCSAARWTAEARAAMRQAWDVGQLPIIVGGTGLYLRALIDGLADIPAIPDAIRDEARALMAHLGAHRFFEALIARNPRGAEGLRPSDSQRLTRAYEVLVATGRPLADWHQAQVPVDDQITWIRTALMPDRPVLHQAIDQRFASMVAQGALDEVRAFADQGFDPNLPIAKVLGLRPLLGHLKGEMTIEGAITQASTDTRRYAKRQMTWIRTQMMSSNVIFGQEMETRIRKIDILLKNLVDR